MTLVDAFTKLMSRFRYPVSMPEDVARDLGLFLPNTLSFANLLRLLNTTQYRPTKLWRHMPRPLAEMAFTSALKKETFRSTTFFSYYFSHGWVVLALSFDEEGRLHKLHLQCPSSVSVPSFDIPLDEEFILSHLSP